MKGNLEGCRDLHIETDWLLLYEIKENTLGLARTGTHAYLFGK
ncbi:MAG: type II toxin-antitoxin system mRNA interferase toxin, RelE/StbE family [Synergistaceae bacterium]|nr:type II toxin-antitoxin system mRNA interferase toxin, RelE/StbE family [Synergistaceae bacterium]